MEKAKLLEAVKRSVAAGGWKVGRDEEIERRMFTGSESTLYDTILVDTRTSLHWAERISVALNITNFPQRAAITKTTPLSNLMWAPVGSL